MNHANDVFGRDMEDAESDDEVIANALTIYRSGIGKGFEIWRDDKLVHIQIHA